MPLSLCRIKPTSDMEKIYGTTQRQDGLQRIGRNKWMLYFGYYETEGGSAYEYRHTFTHKPSLEEIKEVVIMQINAEIDERILSGYRWRDMPVWLSTENQFNYKAAYDIAVQTGGSTLPVTFKFGTDGKAIYHKFETLEELSDFYINCLAYVQSVLADGWQEKEDIDWGVFES